MAFLTEINFEAQLIEEIKKVKCLYDIRSASYRNTILKGKMWREIGEKLGVSDEVCQKRWKTLRDRYTREMKKRNMPSVSGKTKHVEWELLENLSFLSDIPTNSKSRGNTDFLNDIINKALGVSDERCQKKLKTLKDRYTRAMKKRNLPPRSGHKKHVECELLQKLPFLSDIPTSSKSRGNTDFPDDIISEDKGSTPIYLDETEDSSFTEAENNEVGPPKPKRRRKYNKVGNIEQQLTSLLSKYQTRSLNEEGANQLFGKTIGKLLDDLPEEVQEDARLHILTYVTNLKKETRVMIPNETDEFT